MSIDAVRTPEARFQDLPGYAFAPNYLDDLAGYEALRWHYLDEGPPQAERTFLCLHGEPTWAYLYRKMIPVFAAAGHRVVAPDFFGFGRSDKPVDDEVYSYGFHRAALLRFVERLDLRRVTLVCQDWGGILGLSLPMEMPERFERLVVMNTAIPDGRTPPGKGFLEWRAFCAAHPDLDVAGLMKRAVPGISAEECAAYAAPFPDARHKAGVRTFPALVPVAPDMAGGAEGGRAIAWFAEHWTGPVFMAVGVQDPVLGPPAMQHLRGLLPGCPEPLLLEGAGHFVQEWGAPLAQAALDAFGS